MLSSGIARKSGQGQGRGKTMSFVFTLQMAEWLGFFPVDPSFPFLRNLPSRFGRVLPLATYYTGKRIHWEKETKGVLPCLLWLPFEWPNGWV